MTDLRSHRLLIVEDSTDDVLLMVAELERVGLKIKYDCVETLDSFERALHGTKYDAILCDHRMPTISSVNVLGSLKRSGKTTPLIIISGAIGDEIGRELSKLGARNFLLNGDLTRLPELLIKVKEERIRMSQ